MSIKQRTKTINGNNYGLYPMPPLKALVFIPRLATTLAKAGADDSVIGGFNSLFDNRETIIDNDGQASLANLGHFIRDRKELLSSMLGAVAALDPEKATNIIKDAMYGVSCNDGKLDDEDTFEHWFSKHPKDMFTVCGWAIFEHQKDFLMGGLKNSQSKEEKKVSQSQKNGK